MASVNTSNEDQSALGKRHFRVGLYLLLLCLDLVSLVTYKMLSYRRETTLQDALVLAKSGRLEHGRQYFTDIKQCESKSSPPPKKKNFLRCFLS